MGAGAPGKKKKKKQFFFQSNCKLYFIFLFTFLIFFLSLVLPFLPQEDHTTTYLQRRRHCVRQEDHTATKALCPPRLRPGRLWSRKAPVRLSITSQFSFSWRIGLGCRAGSLNSLMFSFLSFLCLFSFLSCVLIDPGRVPDSYILMPFHHFIYLILIKIILFFFFLI
jgi:hypothetical protein